MSAKKTKNISNKKINGGHDTMRADTDRTKAVDLAITQIERQFGKGSIMKLGGGEQGRRHPRNPDGRHRARCRTRRGRHSPGTGDRDFRPRIRRKNDPCPAHRGRGAETERPGSLHRRRARPRCVLPPQDRRQYRRPADLTARQRRAGPPSM